MIMRVLTMRRVGRLLLIGYVALAAASCGGGHSGRANSPTAPTQPVDFGLNNPAQVTAIGDSITAGNEPGARPYPGRLEAMLRGRNPQARVNNRGESGQRTIGGLSTVRHALVADKPGFLLIMEGTNDVRTGVSLSVAADNLREMVRLAKDNHTVPILATVPRQLGPSSKFLDGVTALNGLIRGIASDERVTLANVFDALPDESFFASDGLHPSSKGDEAIAVAFDQALRQAGFPTALMARRPR